MIKQQVLLLCCLLLMAPGCAWQRIPPMPDYVTDTPIPLKVGVQLGDRSLSASYGSDIVNQWKEMRLFEGIVYPYREGDPVDAVMDLSVGGGWKADGGGKGFIIGLTLGLAGTVIGPGMTGTHDAHSILNKGGHEVARYSVHVTNDFEWGLFASTNEVSNKADELQRRTLAVELAKKIRADRQTLISQKYK